MSRPCTCRCAVVWVLAFSAASYAASTAAGGGEPKRIASYCSPTGDLCFGVINRSGAVSLELSTFARYFGRYHLCIRPPRGSTSCKSFPIRKRGSLYTSHVRWHLNFPARGPGLYQATWKLKESGPLGPQLKFRLPLS